MKKTARKVLLMACSALLLVCLTVSATVAYLSSTSEVVENTFTVGKVKIKLDEAKVDEYGVAVTPAERVTENEYKLMPGHTYTKDPTVTVEAGSEPSYVRVMVTITKQAELDAIFAPNGLPLDQFFGGTSSKWVLAEETENGNTRVYEFRYNGIVDAREAEQKLEPLFQTVIVPGTIDNDQLKTIEGLEIDVVAHAIQADGFEGDVDKAWGSF